MNLKNHFHILVLYQDIDSNFNKKIDLDEFKKLIPKLKKIYIDIGDEKEVFKKIDTVGSGNISFQEFFDFLADFMIKSNYIELI